MSSCIQSLMIKNIIEKGRKSKVFRVYSRLFLMPKSYQRWRPVIYLTKLNPFLIVEKFKMETLQPIRASLVAGERVSSIDLPDAYLPIPNFKEIPPVHPQVSNLPVHLSSLWASYGSTSLHNDSKGSEGHGSVQRSRTSSITRLAGPNHKKRHN